MKKFITLGAIAAIVLFLSAGAVLACYKPPQEIICDEGYHLVENECVQDEVDPTPTPTETPVETPTPEPQQVDEPKGPETFVVNNTTDAPGVCADTVPGNVANINVVSGTPNDGKVEVQWSLPSGANQVHIVYKEYSESSWTHALLNTDNDGHEVIGGLKNGVNYNFAVAGVNGCAVGKYSASFDPKP